MIVKSLLTFVFSVLCLQGFTQVVGDFRTFQTGDWNNTTTWARFDGSIWVNPAPFAPTDATAGIITVRNPHIVTVTANVAADETTVQSGGSLTVNGGIVLTISDGGSTDLTNSGTVTTTGESQLVFQNSASYDHARNGGTIPLATWISNSLCTITGVTNTMPVNLNPSGGFQNFTWNCAAQTITLSFEGALINVLGNLVIQNSNAQPIRLSQASAPSTINIGGNFDVAGTRSRISLTTSASPTINVGGDFNYTSTSTGAGGHGSILKDNGTFSLNITGNFNMNSPGGNINFSVGASNGNMNINGDFVLTAGFITETATGTGTFNFNRNGTQNFTNTGSILNTINYTVSSISTLNVIGESALTGTGSLVVDGRIRLGSLAATGAITANVATTGNVRTTIRTFNPGSRIIYAGTGPQFIGSGQPLSAGVVTEIDNTNGVTFGVGSSGNSSATVLTIADNLVLTTGNLNIVSTGIVRSLTLNGSVVPNSNNITITGANSDLVINGTGAFGSFPFPAGSQSFRDFTLNRTASGSISFANQLTITGAIILTNGTVDFNGTTTLTGAVSLSSGTTLFFEDQSLTLGGNFTTTGGFLSSNTGSSLTLTGATALTSPLSFSPTGNSLGSLILNKSNVGVSAVVNAPLTIASALTLTAGQLSIIGSNLSLNNGATLSRNSAASISTSRPAGGPWNLIYTEGSMSTGLEIPVSGNVTSVVVNTDNGTTVTLGQVLNVSGGFTISSPGRTFTPGVNNVSVGSFSNAGTFNAPTAAASTGLTVSGNFVNDGTFNNNTGSVVIAGPVTMSGATINSTTFNNLVINPGADLTPPTNLTIQGNFTNNGGFNPGLGTTVTFNGTVGAKILSGTTNTQFINITLNKSNGGVSLSVTSPQTVTNTLTLTAGQMSNGASNLALSNGATISRNSAASISGNSPSGGPWNLIYTGGSLTTSLEIPAVGSVLSLTLNTNNPSTITLNQNLTVTNGFSNPLAGRTFTCGTNNLTVTSFDNSGTFNAPTTGATTGLTVSGNFTNNGTFAHNNGTLVIGGAVAMGGTTIASTNFNNILINPAATLTPASILNVQGNFTNNGGFTAGTNSVVFGGSVGSKVLSGLTNTQFYNLTLDKSNLGVSLSVTSIQTVTNTFVLGDGQLDNVAGNFRLSNGATLNRVNFGTISSASPGDGPWNLVYSNASMTTGLEIPASGNLLSLTVNTNSGTTVTLANDLNITNNLTINPQAIGPTFTSGARTIATGTLVNSGIFNAPSPAFNFTLTGDFTNNGTFNSGSGTVVFNGTSSLLGSNINSTNFNNITINPASTLTSSTSLNVQGNFSDSGSFIAASGTTVVFSGTVGSKVISGTANTQFNNVTLNKTNAGVSVTVSSTKTVNNLLTLTQGQLSITGSNLLMANGATLSRNSNSSIVTSSPSGGPYNLIYVGGSMSTGLEIPAGNLQTLTVNTNSGTVITLTGAVTILGDLTLNAQATGPTFTSGNNPVSASSLVNSGIFNAPTPAALTLDGLPGNLTNNGTFNRGAGRLVVQGTIGINGTTNPTLHNITIAGAGTFISPASLLMTGSFTNNGVFTSGTGTVFFNGTALQDISGLVTTTFNNITLNNTIGVRVENNNNLAGILTMAANTQFDPDGSTGNSIFTLLSTTDDPTQDASIAILPATASVNGQITVQRFMGAEGTVNRYISSPVSNATVSQLSDDFDIDGFRYYDETLLGTGSIGYTYVNSWEVMVAGRGYLAYMWDGAINITWDVRGPLNNTFNRGTVDLNVTHTPSSPPDVNADGWNLVGNPYPSAISWENDAGWNRPNPDIGTTITVPDIGGSPTSRVWNYFDNSGNLPGGIVSLGQAFWVYAAVPGASLIVNEQAKVGGAAGGSFYRTREAVSPSLQMSVKLKRFDGLEDNAFLKINPDASAEFDPHFDAYKFYNEEINVSLVDGKDHSLVMHTLNEIGEHLKIPLELQVSEPGEYHISFENQDNFPSGSTLYLVDNELGTNMPITYNASYSFTIREVNRLIRDRFLISRKPLTEKRVELDSFIQIYPNPVTSVLNVKVNEGKADLTLLDVSGRVLLTRGLIDEVQLDFDELPKGIYILKLSFREKTIVRKIIKD